MISHPTADGTSEWVLRGRSVWLPDGPSPAAVLIRGGTIADVLAYDAVPAGVPMIDAGDADVLPGLVETHAHINEPGRADWEGFATATRAAAAGGITTLIDMPLNSSPVTTTLNSLRMKQQAAVASTYVDLGFHAGVVPELSEVHELIDAGVTGFKAFLCHSGIDEFPNATEADLGRVMPLLARAGVPLLVHAELISPLPADAAGRFEREPRSFAAWLATRPALWEENAIRLMIDLCRDTGCAVHIVHLAAANECRAILKEAKQARLPLTVETCPHYLTFAAEEIPDGDTRYKCAPPLRERVERDTLRQMVISGEIDTLGSDHSPAPPAIKHLDDGNLRAAWGGIASLQLLLPASLTAVGHLAAIVPALTSRPAKLAGLSHRKGAIAPGMDADFAIVDASAEFTVVGARLQHRHPATPYEGRSLKGVVRQTILRGRMVFDGESFAEPGGTLLERKPVKA